MANAVLKFRDQTIRINYHDLAEVLAMLNQRLETASPARQVTEPWLNHIQEDLGYSRQKNPPLRPKAGELDFETGT
jgi:hypothetical protein